MRGTRRFTMCVIAAVSLMIGLSSDFPGKIDIPVSAAVDQTIAAGPIQPSSDLLTQRMRMAKGGLIGTENKGVVALRFDDYQDAFGRDVFPLLVERALPASMALISRFSSSQPWGAHTTWDDIRRWNRQGIEIWSHGTDHRDPTPDGYNGLVREIVTSKKEIESQGIKCMGWVLPGVTQLTDKTPYNVLGSLEGWMASDEGRLVQSNYALSEAYLVGAIRPLPTGMYHGLDHISVSEKGNAVERAKQTVQDVIKRKYGVEFMVHTGVLGLPGYPTLAEFKDFLDFLASKRDQGQLEILTPSGLMFADPSSSHRLDLLTDGGAEGLTSGAPGAWTLGTSATMKDIKYGAAHTGIASLVVSGQASDQEYITQLVGNLKTFGVAGEQFMFEGWFRALGGAAQAKVSIQDPKSTDRLSLTVTRSANGTEWTLLRLVVGIPPDTDLIRVGLGHVQGGIEWDDISLKKL